ncbi:MAG: NifU family protein [Acidobacteria bacterium]|nr:NifU family protein [Acidobacteriota bacterium]
MRTASASFDLSPIETALDQIRPFLHRDGGDIQVVGLTGHHVRLRLISGGPATHAALRRISSDLERYLRDRVPGLDGVELA